MTERTPRFALPLLQAGQAQKEATHNEAIVALEMLAQPIVETIGDNMPPTSPIEGRSWIVGAAPTGAWAGHADALAGWTSGGWRFVPPVEGMAAALRGSGLTARRGGAAWSVGDVVATRLVVESMQVVGARQPAIGAPTGGSVNDAPARDAIAAILNALRAHGLIQP